MEEDIKILEQVLEISKTIGYVMETKDLKALENLLTSYKELSEDNALMQGEYHRYVVRISNLENQLDQYEKGLDPYKDSKFTQVIINTQKKEIKQLKENCIPKSKIKEKIEEQLEEAKDILENKNYLDNFNGNKDEQTYYYEGYKDATLFLQELLEEEL